MPTISRSSIYGVTACLLKNEPASCVALARLTPRREVVEGKPSLNRAISQCN